jgi:hypothetical protein
MVSLPVMVIFLDSAMTDSAGINKIVRILRNFIEFKIKPMA